MTCNDRMSGERAGLKPAPTGGRGVTEGWRAREDSRPRLISDVVTGKLYVRQAMVDSSLSLE